MRTSAPNGHRHSTRALGRRAEEAFAAAERHRLTTIRRQPYRHGDKTEYGRFICPICSGRRGEGVAWVSVAVADDGWLLACCHASGCRSTDVLRALGIDPQPQHRIPLQAHRKGQRDG